MRKGYVPRDVPESATYVSSKLKDLIRVLNFTRSDTDINKRTMSHTTHDDNSLFTDDLSYSGRPLNYILSLTIIDAEDEMDEEYLQHDMSR